VVSVNPKETGVLVIEPQTAGFVFNRKIYLGEVEMMNYRFKQIYSELQEEFTCGKYHIFDNNCNHFSNKMTKMMLGI